MDANDVQIDMLTSWLTRHDVHAAADYAFGRSDRTLTNAITAPLSESSTPGGVEAADGSALADDNVLARARQLALDALLFLSAQGDLLRGEAELRRADIIRKEQEAIADRWNHESLKRGPLKRYKSKHKKNEAKATAEEAEKHVISCSVRSRLVGVLRAYDRKVLKARHFHKAFNHFCRSGLLEKYKDPQNKVGEGGRFKTLHASGESSIKMLCSLSRDIKKHEVDRFV